MGAGTGNGTGAATEWIDLSVFDDATDGVVAFADDRRYVYANDSALRLYGAQDLVGQLHGRGTVAGSSVVRACDGRFMRVRYRATTISPAGLYLAVVSPDAPAAPSKNGREAPRAELFQAVFEHAPAALLVADDRRYYLYGNRLARSFLGMSREALVGKRVDDLATPATQRQLEGIWEKFLARGTMSGIVPIRLTNGLQRNILLRARAHVRPGRHLISFHIARPDRRAGLKLDSPGPAEPLTFRERELLTLLARGSTAQGIADAATLSADTVRTHIRNAMRKLGARTRAEAVALAIARHQIEP